MALSHTPSLGCIRHSHAIPALCPGHHTRSSQHRPAAGIIWSYAATKSSSSSRTPFSKSSSHATSTQTFDDFYDSAAAMPGACDWDRVEDDLGLDEAPADTDPQEWEEMISLLSFDGEEHKRVTRHMHGPNARVEDMFASFDGDDFEAVLRAARGSTLEDQAAQDEAAANLANSRRHQAAAQGQGDISSSSSLYQSVCALRAAAEAAELTKKRCPGPKKRKVPLSSRKSQDSWMLQVPYTVAAPSQQQQQQEGKEQQQQVAVVTAISAAAAVTSRANERSNPHAAYESFVVVKSPAGALAGIPRSPASHATFQQLHELSNSSSSKVKVSSAAVLPACAGTEGFSHAGIAATAAAPAAAAAATAQLQPAGRQLSGVSNNIVSSKALVSKLAATAVMVGAPQGVSTCVSGPVLIKAAAPATASETAAHFAVGGLAQKRATEAAKPPSQSSTEQQNLEIVDEEDANPTAASAAVVATTASPGAAVSYGRRWSRNNTYALRRALSVLNSSHCVEH